MGFKWAILLLVALMYIESASALSCVQCNSTVSGDDCLNATIASEICKDTSDDTCYKIITAIEKSNNGPGDRLKDNDIVVSLTRGCANKKSFPDVLPDRRCYFGTMGGGGDMVKCLCSGNGCNGAGTLQASLALILAALCRFL